MLHKPKKPRLIGSPAAEVARKFDASVRAIQRMIAKLAANEAEPLKVSAAINRLEDTFRKVGEHTSPEAIARDGVPRALRVQKAAAEEAAYAARAAWRNAEYQRLTLEMRDRNASMTSHEREMALIAARDPYRRKL